MFRTSTPVTDHAFHDRVDELSRLSRCVEDLRAGAPRWVAVLGVRRVGKTSLLLELTRRNHHADVRFVVIDCFEDHPLGFGIFRRLALRTVDAFFSRDAAVSFEALAERPDDYLAALMDAPEFVKLDRALRADVMSLAMAPSNAKLAEFALGLAERLAVATKQWCVVAWDEFQELAKLPAKRGGVLPLARAVWQRSKRTTYVVCGSERTTLENLVASERSPFFQHFDVMELGPMARAEALSLLERSGGPGRQVPRAVAVRAWEVLGGHPFYLQLFGEALTACGPPWDEALFREVLSGLLFTRTGRLSMYFANEFDRVVGSAATLAGALEAVAAGPVRTMDVARRIGASSGATVRYLERLGDAISRREDGTWTVTDPVFGHWLRWRRPGGTVVPMSVVGDDAEREVAHGLAELGFELVYQSRASRGAFDLLAVRGGIQVGVQVKRTPLPMRLARAATARMNSDAKRLGWRPLVAVVTPPPASRVHFFDGAVPRARCEAKDALGNVLEWLDEPA